MANPNLLTTSSVTQDILAEAQLSSGNNDFTVPSGKAWNVHSATLCNVSASTVTVNLYVIKSGGTARRFVKDKSLAPNESLVVDPGMIAMLPEAATLRINASAGSAVDVMVTGVVSA